MPILLAFRYVVFWQIIGLVRRIRRGGLMKAFDMSMGWLMDILLKGRMRRLYAVI